MVVRALMCTVLTLALTAVVADCGSALESQGAARARDGFRADFASGGRLRVWVRSGLVSIVGADADQVRVSFAGKNAWSGGEVRVSMRRSGGMGDLRIAGGPDRDFQIVVEVPRRSNLEVRMPFGDLTITGVTGDKDAEVHAGNLTVAMGSVNQYAHVDASVLSGEITARPFAVDRAGLFRSFSAKGKGAYRLHAHVGAGDLTLSN